MNTFRRLSGRPGDNRSVRWVCRRRWRRSAQPPIRGQFGAAPTRAAQRADNQDSADEKKKQRRLLEPSDKRHRNGAGRRRRRRASRLSSPVPTTKTPRASSVSIMLPNAGLVTRPLNVADVDQIHGDENGRPLAELDRNHLESAPDRAASGANQRQCTEARSLGS